MKCYLNAWKKSSAAKKSFRLFVFIILIFHVNPKAQEKKLIYHVIRKGDIIGTINLEVRVKDNKVFLSLRSKVKTRFIFSFSDYCEETSTYEEGVMVHSSFYQKQNGS